MRSRKTTNLGWLLLVLAFGLTGTAAAAPAALPSPAMPLPPATLDDNLLIEGDAIAAREYQARMTVPVTINGRGPYRFVVDSGADRTVVGRRIAAQLGLPHRGTANLNSMTGTSRVELVGVERLGLGSTNVRTFSAPVLEERHLGAQGILGIDSLVDQRVMLDFDRDEIVVQDARRPSPRASSPDEIVITARRRRGQLILTEGTINGHQVEAVIDTGAQVTVGNMALRRLLLGRRGSLDPELTTLIGVTGGTIQAEVAPTQSLEFGRLAIRDMSIVFVDAPPFHLFGLADRPALLLGADVLKSFRRVSLDFRRRKVRFETR